MVGSSSEKGFGQRDEQNWSWVNQSLIAVTHRLYGRSTTISTNRREEAGYHECGRRRLQTANWIVLAVAGLIGLGFILVIPARDKMTPRSTAEELGILFCLMTVASPLAREYYFVWLFLPLTVLMHRAAFDDRPRVRTGTWALLAVTMGLLALSLPLFPTVLQAWGNNLWATALLAIGLGWHMHHAPASSLEVKPGR